MTGYNHVYLDFLVFPDLVALVFMHTLEIVKIYVKVYYFMCMGVLRAYMCPMHIPDTLNGSLGTGVTDGCVLAYRC